jgi:hypothetical protein
MLTIVPVSASTVDEEITVCFGRLEEMPTFLPVLRGELQSKISK